MKTNKELDFTNVPSGVDTINMSPEQYMDYLIKQYTN